MGGGWGGREEDYIPIVALSTRMTPAFTEMGSDESHLNVPLIVRDKVTRVTVSTNPAAEPF